MSKINQELIKNMAPDSKALAAAKKIAAPTNWSELGRSSTTLWGYCQGSDRYSVYAGLNSPASVNGCSCPSRKRPCKHLLALLMLDAGGHPIPDKDVPATLVDDADSAYYEGIGE